MLSGTKCPAGKQLIPRSQIVIYLFKKLQTLKEYVDSWLAVHRSITLVDFHLDAQNSYLYIIHLLKTSTCFEHYPAHLQEVYVVIVYMQNLVSALRKK
jgi:hypothetical protein